MAFMKRLALCVNDLLMRCMVRIDRLQGMHHGSFHVLHLFSDYGPLVQAGARHFLDFLGSFPLGWLFELINHLLENIPLFKDHISSFLVFMVFLSSVSATTLPAHSRKRIVGLEPHSLADGRAPPLGV